MCRRLMIFMNEYNFPSTFLFPYVGLLTFYLPVFENTLQNKFDFDVKLRCCVFRLRIFYLPANLTYIFVFASLFISLSFVSS